MPTDPYQDDRIQPLVKDFTIRVADFEVGRGMQLMSAVDCEPEEPLIQGRLLNKNFGNGLSLTYRNAREAQPFDVESRHDAGLSCIFFMRGDVNARVGQHAFRMYADQPGLVNALGIYHPEEEPFRRTTHQPQLVQHLVINAKPDWLEAAGFAEQLEQRSRQNKGGSAAFSQWDASSQRLNRSVSEFFSPLGLTPELLNLHLEARALDLIMATLGAMIQPDTNCGGSGALTRHDRIRLQRAIDLIADAPSQTLTVDQIARHAGVSPSGLQRLFRREKGCSVFQFIKEARMDHAHQLLRLGDRSISEISYIAGYNNPSNFSTAFKRKYGVSPRQISRVNRGLKTAVK